MVMLFRLVEVNVWERGANMRSFKIFSRIKKYCTTNIVIENEKIFINGERVSKDDPRYQKIRKDFKADMRQLGKDMQQMAKDLEDSI